MITIFCSSLLFQIKMTIQSSNKNGSPIQYVSHIGRPFDSHAFSEFSREFWFAHRRITPYWSRANDDKHLSRWFESRFSIDSNVLFWLKERPLFYLLYSVIIIKNVLQHTTSIIISAINLSVYVDSDFLIFMEFSLLLRCTKIRLN